MKLLAILAGFALLVLVGVQAGGTLFSSVSDRANVAASFINDSVIIDVDDTVLDSNTIPEATTDTIPPETVTSDPIVFSDDENDAGDVIDEVVIEVTTQSDNAADSSSTTGDDTTASDTGGTSSDTISDSETTNTTEQTVSASSILQTLTGNQAVTTVSGGGSGGGASGTSVSADKTRDALLSRKITNITIPEAPTGSIAAASRPPYSRADLALIVSAALVKNPDLDDVFYSTNTLSISYKARGRLLLAIPVSYTATLDLAFDEATEKKRVRVKFPWYRFFMYTGVSKSNLRAEVDGVISRAPAGQDYDRAAQIFNEVASLLERTRGFRALQ